MPNEEIEIENDQRFGDAAQWKMTQKNTFTRWVNERLKAANKRVDDLAVDFSDGLYLIHLVEVLSGKKVQRYTKRPTFRPQKMENITMALKFLQSSEKIRIVNIDSSDIVDQNLKLILGLVWTLILHYSISTPNWGDDNVATSATPKQRLLTWVRQKLEGEVMVSNFTSDWKDGKALGALVDAVAPGLCPDWEFWREADAVKNTNEAITSAEKWLHVAPLITADEVCTSDLDEQSMMTYLAQFPNATLLPGAPLRTRTRPSRVRGFGPGLERSGVRVGEMSDFTIETHGAGDGEVDVVGIDPSGKDFPVTKVFNNDTYLTYSCSYRPTSEGTHHLSIFFAGREIPKSPFSVSVSSAASPKSREGLRSVTEERDLGRGAIDRRYNRGDGNDEGMEDRVTNRLLNKEDIEDGMDASSKVDGWVGSRVGSSRVYEAATAARPQEHFKDAAMTGKKIVALGGVRGREEVVVEGPGVEAAGLSALEETSFTTHAKEVDASRYKVSGRGVQKSGLKVHEAADFKVSTLKGYISDPIDVRVQGEGGSSLELLTTQLSPREVSYTYVPTRQGPYVIQVRAADHHLDKSPYEVQVEEARECPVKAYGPSLHQALANKPAVFCLETNGETGALAFSIEGTSKADIECLDNEDGSAFITFYPTLPGEYAIHILCDDHDISGSPFISNISNPSPQSFLSNVAVHGELVEKPFLVVNRQYLFSVEAVDLQTKPDLEVAMYDATGHVVAMDLVEKTRDMTTYSFTPTATSRYTLLVTCGGVMMGASPYRLISQEPSDPSKVSLRGPALTTPLIPLQTSHLIVDCSLAGPGDVAIMLTDDQNRDVAMETEDIGNNSFEVSFKATRAGVIEGKVFFSDVEVPGSPFQLVVEPPFKPSNITISTPHSRKYLNSPVDFQVDTTHLPIGDVPLTAFCVTPSGDREAVAMEMKRNGLLTGSFYMSEAGKHLLELSYEGCKVGGLEVEGLEGGDASRVKVHGPGLETGWTNTLQVFTVETKGAGQGGLNVGVSGPSQVGVVCRDNRDGTCTVEYSASTRGAYQVSVTFREQAVPGSPFKVDIKDKVDFSKLKLDDIDRLEVVKGQTSRFRLDARGAGSSDLKVVISDSQGFSKTLALTEVQQEVYEAAFLPSNEGLYCIEVWYAGSKVKSSKVQVKPSYAPEKVKVEGGGVSRQGVTAGKEVTFTVDMQEAGRADLSVHIEDHLGKRLEHTTAHEAKNKCKVTYLPREVGHVNVMVKYGGGMVPGSPFVVPVVPVVPMETAINHSSLSASPVVTNGVHQNGVKQNGVQQNRGHQNDKLLLPADIGRIRPVAEPEESFVFDPVTFNLPVGPILGFVQAKVQTPSGVTHVPELESKQEEQATRITYLPTQPGEHLLFVDHNDQPLSGASPLRFHVPAPSPLGKVKVSGSGLSAGFCRAACCFNVALDPRVQHAGIAINVDGPSKAEVDVQETETGLDVVYRVTRPGSYLVSILYAHHHIHGSPFTVNILPFYKESTRAEMFIGPRHEEAVNLGLSLRDLSNVRCLASSPSGVQQNVSLKILPGGMLGAVLNAREDGTYSFELSKAGNPLTPSPIRRFMAGRQSAHAEGVRVFGEGLERPRCKQTNHFQIDYKNAGAGALKVSIDGPSRVEMESVEDEDRVCTIGFTPVQAGTYILTVLFSNTHVLGSPFLFDVKGSRSEVRSIEEDDDNLDEDHAYTAVNQVGRENLLHLAIPEALKKKLNVYVSGPSGDVDSCYFKATPSSFNPAHSSSSLPTTYSIGFVAKETGIHLVHVNHAKTGIPGSPYKFLIGPLSQSRNDVVVHGEGLVAGYVNTPGTFTIDSSNAGDGNLSITMEGVVKPDVTFRDGRDGSCHVTYVCSKPGVYLLSIRFNGEHVRASPFAISIEGQETSQEKESAATEEEEIFLPKQPVCLEVYLDKDLSSRPDAIITGPSKKTILPILQQTDAEHYTVRFIPREEGLHLVDVVEKTAKGSSKVVLQRLEVYVGEKRCDPSKVKCSPVDGWEGRTGERFSFEIDTTKAGVGSMEVVVDGPSKVFLTSHPSTPMHLHFEPPCPGFYKIQIFFGGKLVPSGPFTVHVKGSGRPLPWNEVSRLTVQS